MNRLLACRINSKTCKYVVATLAILAFMAYEYTVWRAL